MKLLHVNELAQFKGGVERILVDTARGFNARGFRQGLLHFTAKPDLRLLEPFEQTGTTLAFAEQFKPDLVLIHKAPAETVAALVERFRVARMVHDHDLVCLRRHKYFPVSTQICEQPAGLSCLLHLCFLQPNRGGRFPIRLASLRKQLQGIAIHRRLSGLIVGSQWMRQSLLVNGFTASQLAVIPPVPADLDRVKPIPFDPHSRELLFVGQMIRGKGIDLMLEGLARLSGDWQAVFVGEGNFLDSAKQLADRLQITDRVEFAGWIDHNRLNAYYARARALIVPSRWPEPFGMVGIEAMARARPVIGFAAGGIPDWLDATAGILVPAADVSALAAAMQRLLDDSQLAGTLGQGARFWFESHYGYEPYLDALQHYLEMIA